MRFIYANIALEKTVTLSYNILIQWVVMPKNLYSKGHEK